MFGSTSDLSLLTLTEQLLKAFHTCPLTVWITSEEMSQEFLRSRFWAVFVDGAKFGAEIGVFMDHSRPRDVNVPWPLFKEN